MKALKWCKFLKMSCNCLHSRVPTVAVATNENRRNIMTCQIRQESQQQQTFTLEKVCASRIRRRQRQRQQRHAAAQLGRTQVSRDLTCEPDLAAKLDSVRFLRPFRSVLFGDTRTEKFFALRRKREKKKENTATEVREELRRESNRLIQTAA